MAFRIPSAAPDAAAQLELPGLPELDLISGRRQSPARRALRRMGKAGFFHLMQSGERLQVYVRSDSVSEVPGTIAM